MIQRIGVIGAGAWGTALAQVAAARGHETLLWAREPEVVAAPALSVARAVRASVPAATLPQVMA